MPLLSILISKPVLIGLHLGSAIVGIDAYLWLAGQVSAKATDVRKRIIVASIGLGTYLFTWLVGGYYYVKYYGSLVKPIIKAGSAPWAHSVAMEAKEHIFLFAIPLAVTVLLIAKLDNKEIDNLGIRKHLVNLSVMTAVLGLLMGLMGFIISAAARWGIIK